MHRLRAFAAATAAFILFAPSACADALAEPARIEAGPDTVLAGEWLWPEGDAEALIVLVTGNGPHTRDQVISGSPMFGQLAQGLAAEGIASLRVDEAGVGESAGEITADFRERIPHVAAMVDAAAVEAEARGVPLILLGHSEGAMIAPIVAAERRDVGGLVLLAPPVLPGRTVWIDQQVTMTRQGLPDLTEADYANVEAALNAVVDAVEARDMDAIEAGVTVWFDAAGLLEVLRADGTWEGAVARMQSAEMHTFLTYDPRPALAALNQPVLAIFGEIDANVSPELNRESLDTIAGPGWQIVVMPEADHFFMRAEGGAPGEHVFGQMVLDAALPALIADSLPVE